jgi:phage portal protein BeeE
VVPNGAGVPVEMWVLPSQWVTPRCDGITGKMVDYFEVRAVNGPVEYFDPDEIIWSKNDSPWHPLYCSSRVQNASTTIDAYEMTETARYCGLENGIMAGGVLSFPADVQTDQAIIDRLEARLLAKNGGPTNILRPLITEGGLTWTPPDGGWELAYLQSSDQLRKYIMAHFGLDESMMGFANHSTYAAAVITESSLFKRVFAPRLENRAATLTECLLTRFGTDLKAIYLPTVTMMDPDTKRGDWQVAISANAVTKNEVRVELLGLEKSEDPAADELPTDMMSALGGDMAGWDDEPGQEKPDGAFGKVPRPDMGTFGESSDKGLVNRLADTNGHAKVPKEYTVAELKIKAMKDFEERF